MRQRRLGGVQAHRGGGLAVGGDAALVDAGALDDPLVGGVDGLRELLIGEHAAGQVAAAAEHDRAQHGHEIVPSTRRGDGASRRLSARVWPILSSRACRTTWYPMSTALAKPSGSVLPWLLITMPLRPRKTPPLALRGSTFSASVRNALRASR